MFRSGCQATTHPSRFFRGRPTTPLLQTLLVWCLVSVSSESGLLWLAPLWFCRLSLDRGWPDPCDWHRVSHRWEDQQREGLPTCALPCASHKCKASPWQMATCRMRGHSSRRKTFHVVRKGSCSTTCWALFVSRHYAHDGCGAYTG